MKIQIIQTLSPGGNNRGEKKKQRTGGLIERLSPNRAVILLCIHKVELHFRDKDCQIG